MNKTKIIVQPHHTPKTERFGSIGDGDYFTFGGDLFRKSGTSHGVMVATGTPVEHNDNVSVTLVKTVTVTYEV